MTVDIDLGAVPAEPNTFVGRDLDVREIRDLVSAHRLVTLAGPGGIGKSRLALRVAGLMNGGLGELGLRVANLVSEVPGEPASPDVRTPAYFVEMADLDAPDLVVPRVAATMGVTAEPGRSLEDTLRGALRHRRALLVLDNCERLVDECARLCAVLLACGDGVRLLTTTREPLRVTGEIVWRVPPLSLPEGTAGSGGTQAVGDAEAVRLFVARAQAVRPGFTLGTGNSAPVATLCRALDGIPLAIELAAARVRVLSVEQIAARLDDRFRLLISGDRTAPARQQTLRATVDWSYAQLGAAEQVLLRRLSVFAGGWTLEMAERVCADDDLPEPDVLDRLADLVDKSLVAVAGEVGGEVRYRMLETIRQYAAELLDDGEHARLRDRHLECLAEFAGSAEQVTLIPAPRAAEVLSRTRAEQGNLVAALTWALESGDLATGAEICAALTYGWWMPVGELPDGVRWLEKFAAAGTGLPEGTRGRLLCRLAQLLGEQHDYGRSRSYALAALQAFRTAGDTVEYTRALLTVAAAEMGVGDLEGATRRRDEGLPLARKTGDVWSVAHALRGSAGLARKAGDLATARAELEECLSVVRRAGSGWFDVRFTIVLATIVADAGDPDEAWRLYHETLENLQYVGTRTDRAQCLAGLGRLAIERGDLDAARGFLAEATRLSDAAGQRLFLARELEAFADLAERAGEPRDAATLAGAAGAIREEIGAPPASGDRMAHLLDRLAADVEPDAVRRWHAEGAALTRAEAIALALDPGGGPTAGPAARDGQLTDRELEIAGLLRGGLTNKAIAERLVISPATVARHVANIFTKLDVSSRAQVAAWAAERDDVPGEAP